MALLLLPSDPVANNKAKNSKTESGIILDTKVAASGVGGRDTNAGVDLRFHKKSDHRAFSKNAKEVLCRWHHRNPDDF